MHIKINHANVSRFQKGIILILKRYPVQLFFIVLKTRRIFVEIRYKKNTSCRLMKDCLINAPPHVALSPNICR